MTTSTSTTVRVWDLLTRLFHWCLAFCVIGLLVTGLKGGGAMEWHMRLGWCVLTLLLWRIVWGFVGGYYSRFLSFLYSPLTIWRYLRGQSLPVHDVGHNPLGSLSVWAMLGFLALQVTTGLMSDDEVLTQGPLVKFVSGATVSLATFVHKLSGKYIIITLVTLHIAAILSYLFLKKQNLIKPMVSGDKSMDAGVTVPSSEDAKKQRLFGAVVFAVCVGVVYTFAQRLG